MSNPIDGFVVDTIVRWAHRQTDGELPPRMNFRLVFGNSEIVAEVRAQLEQSPKAWFIVRSSRATDAIAKRHGRPPDEERPKGVRLDAPIIYLLFWQPGDSLHDGNAQGLADLNAVDIAQILGNASSFRLPWEERIDVQCTEAAAAWKHPERAEAHLKAAWRAVCRCARERRGGRQHSIPFVTQLDFYGRFLATAHVPDGEWALTTPAERARRLVRQWGEALPKLSMFRMPLLASILDIEVDPAGNPSRRASLEDTWVEKLHRILGENLDAAIDFSSLSETIAGVQTVEKRLAEAKTAISLSSTASHDDAARALRAFCHDGDPEAFHAVDWLFFKDVQGKRPSSQGLKGLLIARDGTRTKWRKEDRAAQETQQVLLAILGVDSKDPSAEPIKRYVESWTQAVIANAGHGSDIAAHLRSIAAGQPPVNVAQPDAREMFDRVLKLTDTKPEALERLARTWEEFGDPGRDDEVAAPALLLGLARLCARELDKESVNGHHRIDPPPRPDEVLILKLLHGANTVQMEVAATDWTVASRDALLRWMLNDVRRALFSEAEDEGDEENDEENDEEDDMEIHIAVDRRAPGAPQQPIGTIALTCSSRADRLVESTRTDALMSWKAEMPGDRRPASLLRALFGPDVFGQGEGRCPPEVAEAWEAYVRSLGRELGWSTMATLAPVGDAARQWVESWAGAVAAVSEKAGAADAAEQKQLLEKQRDAAIAAREWDEVQRVTAELHAPADGTGSAPPPALDDVRSLLRACTGTLVDRQHPAWVVLTPHHALSLRLKTLSDIVLCDVLGTLWTDGWPSSAHHDLDEALKTWGLPEPIHTYGFVPNEPLVFESWPLDAAGFAQFSRLGAQRGTDTQSLAVKEVAGVINRYATLFPAAADRLHVRISADRHGSWAWRLLDSLLAGDPGFTCDVDLNTDLPAREPTSIEQAIQSNDERRRPFELGVDGVAPLVRFRRRRASDGARLETPLHLALVVAEDVETFRSSLKVERAEGGVTTDLWNPQILFEETRPELSEAYISVGERADGLSRNVARAIGNAIGEKGLVFRERYTFDRARCEAPLAELQSGAHWLVLASRQPLYRAVQHAGPDIARLLDFYSTTERGRPVHVCVSLNSRSADDDLRRLDASLRLLLGPDVAVWAARAVIAAATRFAPGLAMRCAGAVTTIAVEGLVGLLLTGQEIQRSMPTAVVLSLDQHHSLLAKGGQLGDVLAVRRENGHVSIVVGESKFSTGHVHQSSPVVKAARAQVRATVGRLEHLAARHPLSPRVRAALARALVHQVHLANPGAQHVTGLRHLIEASANPDEPLRIESESAGVAHVWSMSASTVESEVPGDGNSTPVHIHSRETTLARLRELGEQPPASGLS